ncbi:hypothetical protein ACWIG3_02830 [Streptomyces celluloflavus]|uniref:Uncharacterized protein n=2 Tax=Streptomyces TaxID=1883 RepID=A0A4Q9HTU6_STRKA|nr:MULTISPECIES: hypothetical protein [Streptomyces]MYU50748.1 hypothetical protein [Streptomyces sp. SID7805]TBO57909.1 hypothetical protein EYS09_20255 [Streptomyces kasugaensis]
MSAYPQNVSLTLDTPEGFHELPLHLPPDVLDAALWELAEKIWPGGTEFQRETTAVVYSDLTTALTADNVLHASVALYETEDGAASTAHLLVRADAVDPEEPEIVAASFQETLSFDEHRSVARVDLPCGPAVLSLHATETEGEAVLPSLGFAHVELYIPAPVRGWLVVLALTTPCFDDLPRYTGILRQIGESLVIRPAEQADDLPEPPAAGDVRAVFG